MARYNWPGNVRELENLIQYISFVVTEDTIEASALPEKFRLAQCSPAGTSARSGQGVAAAPSATVASAAAGIQSLEDMEITSILEAIKQYGNTTEGKIKAAKALGIGKTTLYRKLSEYHKHQPFADNNS
jgi:transcriptional regulator with PAS, ATPase and Fis domain